MSLKGNMFKQNIWSNPIFLLHLLVTNLRVIAIIITILFCFAIGSYSLLTRQHQNSYYNMDSKKKGLYFSSSDSDMFFLLEEERTPVIPFICKAWGGESLTTFNIFYAVPTPHFTNGRLIWLFELLPRTLWKLLALRNGPSELDWREMQKYSKDNNLKCSKWTHRVCISWNSCSSCHRIGGYI